jgi:hypothetical protein
MVAEELGRLFKRFELIDATRVATSGGREFSTNFVSAQYNYWVSLTNSGWYAFPDLETRFPDAEFGATRGDSCLIVVPVCLGGREPDLESLAAGLLATMGINYRDEELKNRGDYAPGDLQGVQFDYARDVDKTHFFYHLGILRGADTGYLVAAWTQRHGAEADRILANAFPRVQFGSSSTKLLSAQRPFTSRERKTQGFVLNQAALFHYKAGDYEPALTLFRAAARASTTETLYAINALQAWRHVERPWATA